MKLRYIASRVLYLVDRGKVDICGVQVDDRPCSNVKDEVLAVPGLQKIACRNLQSSEGCFASKRAMWLNFGIEVPGVAFLLAMQKSCVGSCD